MRRRLSLSVLVVGLIAVGAFAGIATANSQRYDWDCPGTPRASCYAPKGDHSWSSSTAVNQANPYPKCSKLQAAGALISRVCGYGYTIRAQSNDRGFCPYPNPTSSTSQCGRIGAYVGNDTDTRQGLRGVGYY